MPDLILKITDALLHSKMLLPSAISVGNSVVAISLLSIYIPVLYFIYYKLPSRYGSSESSDHLLGSLTVFSDSATAAAYRKYKKTYVSLVSSLPFGAICVVFLYFRCNIIYGLYDGPVFQASMVSGLFGFICYLIYLVSIATVYFTDRPIGSDKDDETPQEVNRWAQFIRDNILSGYWEEAAAMGGVFTTGFSLYGRALAGQCAEASTSFTQLARCNPAASVNGLPTDHVVFFAFLPCVFPLVMRAVRLEALISTWVIAMSFILISLAQVGGQAEWMTIVLFFLPLLFIFEIERFLRLSFLNMELLEGRRKADLHSKEAEMERKLAETEIVYQKELAARERQQLVSLIGNVAHDLKTPLHSFRMEVDFIRTTLTEVFREAGISSPYVPSNVSPSSATGVNNSDSSAQVKTGEMATEVVPKQVSSPKPELLPKVAKIESLLKSLSANTDFMMMAINRGIEFAKASGGIKLSPAMASFNLSEAIAMPLQVIESIKHNSSVRLNPIPSEICSHIITDLHWLRENILCLLSNALKYSNDGSTVTVTVALESIDAIHALFEDQDSMSTSTGPEIEFDHIDADTHTDSPALSTTVSGKATEVDPTSDSVAASTKSAGIVSEKSKMFVRITIEDNGIGIPEEARRKLFRPFQQAQRLAGGTGLGLYSLSKRMEALDGHRGVLPRSDGQSGSAFWFAFPYRPDFMVDDLNNAVRGGDDNSTPSGANTTIGSPNVSSKVNSSICTPRSSTRSLNILVVDDSFSILKVTERSVTQAGHRCETARNGAIALDRLREALPKGEIDIVLIDFQMPVMDGPTCVSRYREFEKELLEKYHEEKKSELERQLASALGRAAERADTTVEGGGDGSDQGDVETKATVVAEVSVTELPSAQQISEGASAPKVPPGGEIISSGNNNNNPRRVPIVGMSANSDDESRLLGLSAGMDAFIPKPFSMKELEAVLAKSFPLSADTTC